jgi:hypothetical protein
MQSITKSVASILDNDFDRVLEERYMIMKNKLHCLAWFAVSP